MITASKAHSIATRMASYKKGKEEGKEIDLTSIIKKISGERVVNSTLPALRYGQSMEKEAVAAFLTFLKETHKNDRAEECGIFLCQDVPFVGSSPDSIISCDCCGK